MPVYSLHPDFKARQRDYELIADCIEGQRKIKSKGERYLPRPNPDDISDANLARYEAYKLRAVFHNATARTVSNMVGQSFSVDPVPTMPDQMEAWLDDIDGGGVSAIQQSKRALAFVTSFARAFIWVDYPKIVGGQVSIADAEKGGIRPRIILCSPLDVINWRVTLVGARAMLSLVVIKELYADEDDGFEVTFREQYRVLRLVDGIYTMERHRPSKSGVQKVETVTPLDGSGQPFSEIPGTFIGAETNSPEIEKPLMLDIANLNVAHYRNSADYEESVYMVGQPTPYLTGLSDSWINNHMQRGIFLGSRECIPLPEGAQAGLLQVAEHSLPKEAMTQKEDLMQALGAKLVERREVQQTATEKGINEASETSILASCCKNVTAAYSQAFRWAAQFANIKWEKPDDILFELNTDFAVARMTSEEAKGVLMLSQGGLITFEEARDKLKTGGWAYLPDEDAKDQLAEEDDVEFEKAKREAGLQKQSSF